MSDEGRYQSGWPHADGEPVWLSEWVRALDEIEMDLREAETMLVEAHAGPRLEVAWRPPVLNGAIPGSLLERALSLQRRQLEVSEALAHQLVNPRGQMKLARRFRGTEHRPVYLDSNF